MNGSERVRRARGRVGVLRLMALNTPHNVTLTEGQIGIILCSLESSVKYADSEYIEEVDTIFNILEGSVDKYYNKIEKARKKQPDMEW